VTGTDPDTVRLYVAADWKASVFDAARDHDDVGTLMSTVMDDPSMRERGDAVSDLAGELLEFTRERDDGALAALAAVDEAAVYEDASEFLGEEFEADVEVYVEDEAEIVDPEGRAERAVPLRPAIHLA
jgi:leucyl-tRNA synthetase